MKFLLFPLILCLCLNSFAGETASNERFTHLSDSITEIPSSLKGSFGDMFNTESKTLALWGGVILTSSAFYIYDEKIYKHVQKFGRKIGLGNDDHTKAFLRVGGVALLQGPSDVGSGLYYIGNGWTQFAIATSFYINGQSTNNIRAKKTGIQIVNSLLSASIPTQLIKRATGREDPYRASKYRGRWRFFDKNYDNDISSHDAVPSGHLMAATSTFAVIDTNYPEYRSVIRPVGIGLLTLLSFQMVNIGVHWVSDYPLALLIGYTVGHRVALNGMSSEDAKKDAAFNWELQPLYASFGNQDRNYGLMANCHF